MSKTNKLLTIIFFILIFVVIAEVIYYFFGERFITNNSSSPNNLNSSSPNNLNSSSPNNPMIDRSQIKYLSELTDDGITAWKIMQVQEVKGYVSELNISQDNLKLKINDEKNPKRHVVFIFPFDISKTKMEFFSQNKKGEKSLIDGSVILKLKKGDLVAIKRVYDLTKPLGTKSISNEFIIYKN